MNTLYLLILTIVITLSGCKQEIPPPDDSKPKPTVLPKPTQTPIASSTPTPIPTVSPTPSATPSPTPSSAPLPTPVAHYPLLWEATRPESVAWTKFAYQLIQNDLANTFWPGATDITDFCPRYNTLSNEERTQFWGLLISAITKFESNFNPASRMHEDTMGTDPVTGEPVYSEGLLQLSYQDTRWAPYCEFDWEKDKKLKRDEPKKTILDPLKNLNCGMRILAGQVKKRGIIAAPQKYAYWSVLIPNGKYTKLAKIIALTKKAPGCE
jgi:hypothetical protein